MSATDELEASPLEQLAGASGRDFPHLLQARDVTHIGLEKRREALARLPHDDNAAVVLMGSWARAEVTAESDDDFMVLVRGTDREDVHRWRRVATEPCPQLGKFDPRQAEPTPRT